MANQAPPVQDYMMTLAQARLAPEKFAMLQYKLATGSPTARRIMDVVKPGEWERAVGDTRQFSDIRCRLEEAIDAWVNSKPTSKGFVWPQIEHDFVHGPEFNKLVENLAFDKLESELNAIYAENQATPQLPSAPATTSPAADQVQADTAPLIKWSLKKPNRLPGYRSDLFKFLSTEHQSGADLPTADRVLKAWKIKPPAGITVGHDEFTHTLDTGKTKKVELKNLVKTIKNLVNIDK